MRRFVYSPRVDAWVKTDWGIVDLSPFIVSGTVTRRVNQVSSASLVLRNPDFRWTNRRILLRPDPQTGQRIEEVLPVFHPMDPICITLTRLKDQPVQVFTGYLDKTPYIELYPGTVKLEASCTLKRILHTYWDPAVSASLSLLKENGWIINRDGQFIGPLAKAPQDGSFGKLLEQILIRVGGWHKENIHIGKIPSGLPEAVAKIAKDVQEDSEAAKKELDNLLAGIIGIGAYGAGSVTSGGAPGGVPGGASATGQVKGEDKITQKLCEIARQYGLPPELLVATAIQESGYGTNMFTHEPYHGWFQQNVTGTPYGNAGINTTPTIEQANDLGLSADLFARAAVVRARQNPALRGDIRLWAETTQGATGQFTDANWQGYLDRAKQMLSQYGCGDSGLDPNSPDNSTAPDAANPSGSRAQGASTSIRGSASGGGGGGSTRTTAGSGGGSNCPNGTRLDAIIAEANRLNDQQLGYTWGGHHGGSAGYDCSGAVSSLMQAAGYDADFTTATFTSDMSGSIVPGEDPNGELTIWVSDAGSGLGNNPQDHMFAEINGKTWGTGAYGKSFKGPGWQNHPTGNFVPYHLKQGALSQCASQKVKGNTSVPGGSGSSGGGGGSSGGSGGFDSGGNGGGVYGGPNPIPWSQVRSEAKAVAFATLLEAPSLAEIQEAALLTGKKSLLNDKPLLPFVEQLCTASLRSFMSLPNGDFFAFYPDYFGGLGRQPYWIVDDIEILDGKITLSDDALATHVYVVGDTSAPFAGLGGDGIDMWDRVQSIGVVTIQDAFRTDFLNFDPVPDDPNNDRDSGKLTDHALDLSKTEDANTFLQKYGARPKLLEMPMIRNPFYELFMAYQTFCLMWSQQFLTDFSFTFMPELFPGGLVAFPDHGIQCYVDEVTHIFDYESGFHTQATLMAPSATKGAESHGVNVGMVRSGILTGIKFPKVAGFGQNIHGH